MKKFKVTVYERTLESIDLEVEAKNEEAAHRLAIDMLENDEEGEYEDARDWHGTEERYTQTVPSREARHVGELQRILDALIEMGIGEDQDVSGADAVEWLNDLRDKLEAHLGEAQ